MDRIDPKANPGEKDEGGRDLSPLSTQVPPTPPTGENPCKCCQQKTPGWKIVVEVGTFLVALGAFIAATIYAGIAARELTSMNKTYGEIQKQTTLQRQQVVGTFAAAIPKSNPFPQSITDDLELLNYTGIGLAYVNVGKVKATNFTADATLTRRTLPGYEPLGVPEHKQTSKVQMRPSDQTSPQAPIDAAQIRFDTKMLTERDLTLLHNLGETMEISGYFQYDNGFGDTIREPFCFLYITTPQHVFRQSGAATGGPRGGWSECEEARLTIAQSLKWKQKP